VSGALLLAAFALVSSPPARAAEDVRGATPQRGRALVFVFRIDRQPQAAQVPVLVNAELVGELANGTFVAASVDPGTTYLRIGDRVLSTLSFVAAANQRYYVWVDAITGPPLVRTEANLVGEADGQRAVAQTRPAGAPKVVVSPAPVAPAAPVAVAPAAPVAVAPAERKPAAPAAPERDWELALIAKAGAFKLGYDYNVIAGLASTYDDTSKSVFGLEAEFRNKSGLAIGGEVFSYTNDFVTTGTLPDAKQQVVALMANAKYYFSASSVFYPFVGAGVGAAFTDYSGGITGSTTSFAYQGMAGLEMRFKPIGVYLEYKYLGSKWGDADVKIGGNGFFGGISYTF
jgi:opacity protein-like surface antigen